MTAPLPLTPVQRDTLNVIVEWIETFGVAPAYVDLCAEMGWGSKQSAHRVVGELEGKGWIAHGRGRARAIAVLHPPPPVAEPWPMLTDAGYAAAGLERWRPE